MAHESSDRLAAILSQCDDFWMSGPSSASGERGPEPAGHVSRDAAYRRLVSDLIKQEIERDTTRGEGGDRDNPSRIEQYLDEYVDVSFGDSTLLELVEHEFVARHECGEGRGRQAVEPAAPAERDPRRLRLAPALDRPEQALEPRDRRRRAQRAALFHRGPPEAL